MILDLTRLGYSFTLTVPDEHLQQVWDMVAKEYGNGTTLDMAEGERIFKKHSVTESK